MGYFAELDLGEIPTPRALIPPQDACRHPANRLEVYHDNDGSISAYCGKCGVEIFAAEELSTDDE